MKNVIVCAFVCIGILAAWHRERLAAQSGGPVSGPYHDSTAAACSRATSSSSHRASCTCGRRSPSRWYLSVRPDPDRVMPGGYVNPLLLKNQPAPVK